MLRILSVYSYLWRPWQCHAFKTIKKFNARRSLQTTQHTVLFINRYSHCSCFQHISAASPHYVAEANAFHLLHHIFSCRLPNRKKNRVIISLPSSTQQSRKSTASRVCDGVSVASTEQFFHRNHKVQRRLMQHFFFVKILL